MKPQPRIDDVGVPMCTQFCSEWAGDGRRIPGCSRSSVFCVPSICAMSARLATLAPLEKAAREYQQAKAQFDNDWSLDGFAGRDAKERFQTARDGLVNAVAALPPVED